VLVEWGDVAAAGFGAHLEVRLSRDEDVDDADDPADDSDDDPDDEFGLDEARIVEIQATGSAWAGRWDRVVGAVESYRC
jgi:hypothetical protein